MAQRFHYIDRCRALLMLLGIPYHSALMFGSNWGPPQGDVSSFCAVVAQTLTEFRMPAFFLIAGFFTAMMLLRTAPPAWFRGRLIRLGIPLITATLVIIPLQMLIFSAHTGVNISETMRLWTAGLFGPPENWVSHLWFLYDLILYSALSASVWPLIGRLATTQLPWPVERAPFPALFVVIGLFVAVPLVLAAPSLGETPAGAVVSRLLHNGVFFVLGIALFLRREILDRWLVWSWWRAGAAVAPIVAAVPLALGGAHERLAMLLGWSAAIGGAWLVLAAMKRWGDVPNERVTMFVDASLTIYLVHHPIIYALGLITARTAFPLEAEWLAVVVTAFVLSTTFYLLICRSPSVYLLFNGKGPAQRAAAAVSTRGTVSAR